MYNGEIQISESRLAEFLKTADTLQIQGLADGAATAIPAGKGQKTSRAFGDDSAYDDEDNKYINEERLNNVAVVASQDIILHVKCSYVKTVLRTSP